MSGVLFTCAGQRVDIVAAFKRAGAHTVATDLNRLAPALYYADAHAFVPRVDDADYVATLQALVDEHDISLIVPLTDLDHGVLSRAKDELGALVLLPKPEVVDALADKWLAHLLFVERDIGSPDTWLPADVPGDVEFPLLVKAGHRVTLELSARTRQGAGLAYGFLPQGEVHLRDTHRVVTFIACARGTASGSSADGQPVTFWSGGILARSPRCVPLLIWVDAATAPRHAIIRLGARRCA